MPEIMDIPLADLLVDLRNARLKNSQSTQQDAMLEMAKQQGKNLLALARDIVDKGLDPTTPCVVVSTDDDKQQYVVIEGNRRLVALRALETPELILPALRTADATQLNRLARRYAENPIDTVRCVVFGSEDNHLVHWVNLRHTGQNSGVGIVGWGSDEQDRWAARHGQRSPAGQVIDFVEKAGLLSEEASQADKGIITSVTRLLSNPTVREKLGIELRDGTVYSWYPAPEVAKSLTKIVDDLKTSRIKVGDIYHAAARVQYAEAIPENHLPETTSKLDTPQQLDALGSDTGATDATPTVPPKKREKRGESPRERTTVIPKDCPLEITSPRVKQIYSELKELNTNRFPNACSVALRVLLELSVDHYINEESLMTEEQRRSAALAKRLKDVARHLHQSRKVNRQLLVSVEHIADHQAVLAASVPTFNQYVHNEYVFPKPINLKIAWDELQPFLETLWE